jgi:anaerobic ribonucleoside-triphosphate reductase activating protein
MNYADIKTVDIQDGEGVRVSIYVSGCHFHCKGCHNKEAWDFNYGKKFDDTTIDYILGLMDHEYIAGLSILGGEPLELVNQQGLVKLVEQVKAKFPNKTIWCYTGYDFDKDVLGKMYKEYDYTKSLLENIDIMVDGEFQEEKKMVDLRFRGSTNQRKIDVKESLKQGKTITLKFGDEERYEQKEETKNPKVIFFKEFENKETASEKIEQESAFAVSIPDVVDNDNVVAITPAVQVQEVEEKIAADTIKNNDKNNL